MLQLSSSSRKLPLNAGEDVSMERAHVSMHTQLCHLESTFWVVGWLASVDGNDEDRWGGIELSLRGMGRVVLFGALAHINADPPRLFWTSTFAPAESNRPTMSSLYSKQCYVVMVQ